MFFCSLLCEIVCIFLAPACDKTLIRATEEELDGCMDGVMGWGVVGWMDGQIDGWMNWWMCAWVDGWMDGRPR